MKKLSSGVLLLALAGCVATDPVQDYASENSFSVRYSAYDEVPTLTSQARDMAIKHCAKYGKYANYQGGNALNPLTAQEIHRFSCDSKKTDDSVVIAGQSQKPSYLIIN